MSGMSEPNSGENLALSSSEDNQDLSNSSEFAKNWQNTQPDTIQIVKDAQIEAKKHQIEQQEAEMQEDINNHNDSIQLEIQEISSEISTLRNEISSLESELGNVKEQLKNETIQIFQREQRQTFQISRNTQSDEQIVEQLKTAIQAQRENRERNKNLLQMKNQNNISLLDSQINFLMNQIEQMRNNIIVATTNGSKNIADAETTESEITSEIESTNDEIQKLNNLKQKASYTLSALKRELIINEELSASLKMQIDKAEIDRSKIRTILNRSQVTLWKSQNNLL